MYQIKLFTIKSQGHENVWLQSDIKWLYNYILLLRLATYLTVSGVSDLLTLHQRTVFSILVTTTIGFHSYCQPY